MVKAAAGSNFTSIASNNSWSVSSISPADSEVKSPPSESSKSNASDKASSVLFALGSVI